MAQTIVLEATPGGRRVCISSVRAHRASPRAFGMSAWKRTSLLALALASLVLVGWLVAAHSWHYRPSFQEIRVNLERNGDGSTLRQWAGDFVRQYPQCTNYPCGRVVTNPPLPAIHGINPSAETFREGESDPFLVALSWSRNGPQILIGKTNFTYTQSEAVMWQPGIYITHPDNR